MEHPPLPPHPQRPSFAQGNFVAKSEKFFTGSKRRVLPKIKFTMKKIEKLQKQALRYVFNDFNASYRELLEKANRPLMYTHRLRRMLLFVEKCIDRKCPMYLNDLIFAVNTGSNSRKLKTLVQPKYNS